MIRQTALVLLFPVIVYLELREKFEKKGRIR